MKLLNNDKKKTKKKKKIKEGGGEKTKEVKEIETKAQGARMIDEMKKYDKKPKPKLKRKKLIWSLNSLSEENDILMSFYEEYDDLKATFERLRKQHGEGADAQTLNHAGYSHEGGDEGDSLQNEPQIKRRRTRDFRREEGEAKKEEEKK